MTYDQDDALEQPLFRYAASLDAHQRLRLACRYSDMEGFETALAQGGDPAQVDTEGMNAWDWTVWSGNTLALQGLLEKGPPPPTLVDSVEKMDREEILEVLQAHGFAEDKPTRAFTMEDLNEVIAMMEDCREQFGIQPGNDRYWGYLPFLDGVAVIENPHVLPHQVDTSLSRTDPLRFNLGNLVLGSRGVVVFTSEEQAPQLLLSPEMAQEFAPKLAAQATDETATPHRRLRH